jgi:sigma-B regulation protein RsbU (phosphoserine phosphatase)
VIRLAPGTTFLEYANAGLEGATLISSVSRELRNLDVSGSLLTLFDDPDFGQVELRLESGDSFFVCSDGVIDIRDKNGERFGKDRLQDLLNQSFEDVRDLDVLIRDALEQFGGVGPWPDDTSFVIARAK